MESTPPPDPGQPPQYAANPSTRGVGTPPPQVVYVQSGSRPFGRWISWLGWVGFFVCLSVILGMTAKYQDYFDTTGGIFEKYVSGEKQARQKVAIVDVKGVIGTNNEFVKQQIDRVSDDESVKAIVVRVNSPGGTITGSDYILHHLVQLREQREIPLVVSMGSMATSGGYYVAMAVGDAENTIIAEPTTTTGSIGVIIPHYDLSGLLAKYDVEDNSLVSHPRKQMLSMTRPMGPEDREVLMQYLSDAFQRFKDVVKSGRPRFRDQADELDEIATGEIFAAHRAQELGLVDQLGFIEDAVKRAAEMAGIGDEDYRVVRYKAPTTLIEAFSRAQSRSVGIDLSRVLELSAPQAYYLVTTLPSIAAEH